jgi:hydroxymethylglutaryl-CoA lyase
MESKNMFYGATPIIFELAEKNRNNPTKTEELLWQFLSGSQLGVRFKRQHPIGEFIADFYCHSLKLVIEIDGRIHDLPEILENDKQKELFFKENGIKTIRFSNTQVNKNLEKVISKILSLIKEGKNKKQESSPLGAGGLIECPRDAIQGLHDFIPTEKKVKYINLLLKSGLFDTIDFGSFVSPKAIPQMADTAEVIEKLDLTNSKTKLLAIIANERGANDAAQFEQISYLGYPFSISETFQFRNTNATIAESVERVKAIQEICVNKYKELVIYISMGFGNPYGDIWNAEIVMKWIEDLSKLGINTFSLADTIGVANPLTIKYLYENLIPKYPNLTFGGHFHTTPDTWKEKIEAAYDAGCRRFDGAFLGFGGCPMAQDDLVGNMPTENLLQFLAEKGLNVNFNKIESLKLAFNEMIKKIDNF